MNTYRMNDNIIVWILSSAPERSAAAKSNYRSPPPPRVSIKLPRMPISTSFLFAFVSRGVSFRCFRSVLIISVLKWPIFRSLMTMGGYSDSLSANMENSRLLSCLFFFHKKIRTCLLSPNGNVKFVPSLRNHFGVLSDGWIVSWMN